MKSPIFESEEKKIIEIAEKLKEYEKYFEKLRQYVLKMDSWHGQEETEEKLLDLQISTFKLSLLVQNLLKIKK
jgi:Tfp pilus assembly major pilin PilA